MPEYFLKICGDGLQLSSANFFVAAAHCVFEQRRLLPAKELIIYFGKTRFDGDMTSDGGVISKEVRLLENIYLITFDVESFIKGGEYSALQRVQPCNK